MVLYSNGGLKTGLKKPVYCPKCPVFEWYANLGDFTILCGIQMNLVFRCLVFRWLLYHFLKYIFEQKIYWRKDSPGFWFTPVQVIDGRGPVVFSVPAEGWEAHANVEPRHLHARDVHVDGSKNRIGNDGQVVQVPIGLENKIDVQQSFFKQI